MSYLGADYSVCVSELLAIVRLMGHVHMLALPYPNSEHAHMLALPPVGHKQKQKQKNRATGD